jgi:lysophospholipase L1-like esterase
MSFDIAGGLKNIKGGPLDSLFGPYVTLAAARVAIPNVVVDGINFRSGKTVGIINGTAIDNYYWAPTDYSDTGLKLVMDVSGKADTVSGEGKVVRVVQIETYTQYTPALQFSNAYYRYDTGVKSLTSRKTRVFSVTEGKAYRLTGKIQTSTTALAVYFGGTIDALTFLGSEFRAPATGTADYVRQILTLPVGTKFIAASSITSVPYPILEDLTISYPGTVYETDQSIGKILRSQLTPSYVVQVPTQQITNGYYRPVAITSVPNTGVSRNSRLFAIDESKSYLLTGTTQGSTTALAVYYDDAMAFLGSEYMSGSGLTVRTRVALTIPPTAKFLGTSTAKTEAFAVLEEVIMRYRTDTAFTGNSTKTIEQLDIEKASEIDVSAKKILRNSITTKYTNITPYYSTVLGFWHFQTGVWSATARSSRMFQISDDKNYVVTGIVQSNVTALAVYFSGTPTALPLTTGLTYLGYELRGPGSGTTAYSRQALNIPAGATYVACDSTVASIPSPILEEAELIYRQDIAYTGNSILTIEDLYNLIAPVTINNFGAGGDSITIRPFRWVTTAIALLKCLTIHNVAIASARWSKTSTYAVTQNYDDPLFAGFSSTSPSDATTDTERQQIANNCAVVHTQKFIAEVTAGTYPVPDVYVFAYGTNTEYGTGTNPNGSVSTATTGKTLDRDDTFNMANSVRWCIQAIMTAYPNCKIFVSIPIQRANPTENVDLLVKIAIIKQICDAMSVPYIDCFSQAGISEKFEVFGGVGRWLVDGIHPSETGAMVHGTFIANFIRRYMLLKP